MKPAMKQPDPISLIICLLAAGALAAIRCLGARAVGRSLLTPQVMLGATALLCVCGS